MKELTTLEAARHELVSARRSLAASISSSARLNNGLKAVDVAERFSVIQTAIEAIDRAMADEMHAIDHHNNAPARPPISIEARVPSGYSS